MNKALSSWQAAILELMPVNNDPMFVEMDEPCPECNGVYLVGDWSCWGMCYECARKNGLLPEFLS